MYICMSVVLSPMCVYIFGEPCLKARSAYFGGNFGTTTKH